MKRKMSLFMAALLAAGTVCGCGASDEAQNTPKEENKKTETSTTASTEKADPFGKYDETVNLTSYFSIAATIMNYFNQSQIPELVYTKNEEELLNIHVDYEWYAADTAEDAEQKKNVAIASGEIPDFMLVDKAQLALLAKSDLINRDIGTIFEQYASDTLMSWTTAEGDAALQSATYDGQVIAIPLVDSSIDGAPFLWIRKDWLEKVGKEVPTTMDELYEVMVAFKEQDPDGNGKDDTVGMVLHKNLLNMGTGDAVGLFNGFQAYPGKWIDDGNGGLTYGSTAPEAKDALAFLAKLYEEGLIEEDFSVKDDSKASELTASGTAGIQYGAMWNAMWPLNMTVNNDPEADWVACPIVSATDEAAQPQIALRITNYVVVSAECEHPEAVVKLLNFWCKAFGESSPEEYNSYLTDLGETGLPDFPQHHVMLKTWSPTKNLDAYYHIKDAMEKNDTSTLTSEELGYYNDIVAYNGGDLSKVGAVKTFAPEGSAFEAMDAYYTKDLFMMDKFTGAQTKTMSKKMSIIEDKIIEYYTKVIMGIESADTFDSFVEEVNGLGLSEITTEVNEWYQSK